MPATKYEDLPPVQTVDFFDFETFDNYSKDAKF